MVEGWARLQEALRTAEPGSSPLGTCRVMTYVGPFRGKASSVHPGILIHARTGGGASLDVAESVAPEARERFGRFLSALVVD